MRHGCILIACLVAAAGGAQPPPERQKELDEAIALASKSIQRDPKDPTGYYLRGSIYAVARKFPLELADLDKTIVLDPKRADAYQERGAVHFRMGKVKESVRDFDKYLELKPDQKASHWQRGISLYYAGQYDEGRRQFEGYQEHDSNDVENAVWRFMCMAKKDGIDKARQAILKIGPDRRVPMKQVYDLFKGDLKPDDVIAAVKEGKPSPEQLHRQLFYAHLYVGIYYDLLGDRKQALTHLNHAADDYPISHYMWDVARVHRDTIVQPLKK